VASVPFDLVIFDNDGVLVDSEGHAQLVLSKLLTELRLPTTPEECFAQFLGSSLASIRALTEQRLARSLPPDFEACYHRDLFEVFRTSLRPVPGVADVLAGLEGPTCVASSGSHERIRVALTATGLLDRFEGRIFSATDVARGKPAPDLFLHAARALGADPSRCAVIEDSRVGVEAANAAGMTAFGFARITPADELRHATGGVFCAMEELPALLTRGRSQPGRRSARHGR
jgi:HAD superfamily hydrolase (TIGR01509 family)